MTGAGYRMIEPAICVDGIRTADPVVDCFAAFAVIARSPFWRIGCRVSDGKGPARR
jgi:hypothetical protein